MISYDDGHRNDQLSRASAIAFIIAPVDFGVAGEMLKVEQQ